MLNSVWRKKISLKLLLSFLAGHIFCIIKELADHLTEIVVDAVQCIRRRGIINTQIPV
jgi:hypothetical protein